MVLSKLPSACHPDAARIRREINEWLAIHWPFPEGVDAMKVLDKHDLGGLAVWCVPDGDAERLIWAGRLCALILLADDYIDNDKDLSKIEPMKTAAEGGDITVEDKATQAINVTWKAVRHLSNKREFKWNVNLTKAWFDTHFDDLGSTLEEYLIARRANIGVHMFLNWVRWALGFDFPEEVLEHPLFRHAEDMVADHAGIVNDYYSYEKEKNFESDGMNVVRCLMDTEGLDLPAARKRVEALLDYKELDFWMATRSVADDPILGANPDVIEYMINLAYVLGGNIAWSEENGRYNLDGVIGYQSLLPRIQHSRFLSIVVPVKEIPTVPRCALSA